MAVTRLDGGLWINQGNNITLSVAGATILDASGEKAAQTFIVPKTGTLDLVEFLLGAIGNPVDNGLKISFQNLDASGNPDGVVDQFRVIPMGSLTANTWTVPGLMTSDGTDGGVKRAVTAGDRIAVVIEFESFVAGDSINIANMSTETDGSFDSLTAYKAVFAASWSKGTGTIPIALKYDDGIYYFISANIIPITSITTSSFGNTSSPDERALRFQVPWACEISGVCLRIDLDGDVDLVLYDSANTVLWTQSLRAVDRINTAVFNGFIPIPNVALAANTTYRLSVKPTSATTLTVYHWNVSTNAHLAACAGGAQFYLSTRAAAGAWTDTNTARPHMGIRLSGIDTGGGAGEHSAVFIG